MRVGGPVRSRERISSDERQKDLRTYPALLAVGALLQATALAADYNPPDIVTLQPDLNATVSPYALDPIAVDPQIPTDEMVQLLRRKIKYVFIIFNENNSFDHRIWHISGRRRAVFRRPKPRSAADTPGFTETYTDVSGETVTVRPFRIGPDENASFADTTDHSHPGLAKKLDVVSGQARMDGFAADEYNRFIRGAAGPAKEAALKQGTQYARLVMSYVDCATIPFFWQWANRFTIFDHIFATQNTPSSPNAIALLAGQSGETQWVKHGAKAVADQPISGVVNGKTYSGAATPAGCPSSPIPNPSGARRSTRRARAPCRRTRPAKP